MSTLYTSGLKVKNVNVIHKWLKIYKCQHYTQVKGEYLYISA